MYNMYERGWLLCWNFICIAKRLNLVSRDTVLEILYLRQDRWLKKNND